MRGSGRVPSEVEAAPPSGVVLELSLSAVVDRCLYWGVEVRASLSGDESREALWDRHPGGLSAFTVELTAV
jgi:hypothetical protein